MHAAFRHCNGCKERHVGCHSTCGFYKDDVELWENIKDDLRYYKDIRAYLDSKKYRFMDVQAKLNRHD